MGPKNTPMSEGVAALIAKNKAAAGGSGQVIQPEWRPLPGFEAVEVAKDGRMRVCRPVEAKRGMVQVQIGHRRLASSQSTIHKLAWPELWPALAGPDKAELTILGDGEPSGPEDTKLGPDATDEECEAWARARLPKPLTFAELRAILARMG